MRQKPGTKRSHGEKVLQDIRGPSPLNIKLPNFHTKPTGICAAMLHCRGGLTMHAFQVSTELRGARAARSGHHPKKKQDVIGRCSPNPVPFLNGSCSCPTQTQLLAGLRVNIPLPQDVFLHLSHGVSG